MERPTRDVPRRRKETSKRPLPVTDARRYRYSADSEAAGKPRRVDVVGDLTYRAWRPGDEVSILDGFNAGFRQNRDLAYWNWKFRDTEFGVFASVAVDDAGTAHAFYGAMPTKWRFDGGEKVIGLAADVHSRRHPRVIRENAFVRVLHHFLADNLGPGRLSLIQGFAGRTPIQIYEKHVDPLGVLPLMVLERRNGRGLWPLLRNRGTRELRGAEAVAALERLWQSASWRYPRAQIRDSAWAHRRFQTHPGRTYDQVVLTDPQGTPRLWWVGASKDDVLEVCDFLWDGDTASLIDFDVSCRRAARRAGCSMSRMMLHNDPNALTGLHDLGWAPRRHPEDAFWVMQTGDPEIDASILSTVYLTFGDTDLC